MLVVFDLDDTLYLERDYVRSGFLAVGQWLEQSRGIKEFAALAWDSFQAGTRGHIFDEVLTQFGINDPALISAMVTEYRQHRPSIDLLLDAQMLLSYCREMRVTTALITDGMSASQWAKIAALRLTEYIEHIVVTDDWGSGWQKPNPRAFETVQRERPGTECVYLADNPQKDFQAPAQLGWRPSIRVRRSGSLHEAIPTPRECFEVPSLAGVTELLSSERKHDKTLPPKIVVP